MVFRANLIKTKEVTIKNKDFSYIVFSLVSTNFITFLANSNNLCKKERRKEKSKFRHKMDTFLFPNGLCDKFDPKMGTSSRIHPLCF